MIKPREDLERKWRATQRWEISCFYCGNRHMTGDCPTLLNGLKSWKFDCSCPETGHIRIVPSGNEYPTVLGMTGKYYRVVGVWGVPRKILWLDLERFCGDTIIEARFCPDELMEMDLGMSDDEELSCWLGGAQFLSAQSEKFNGSEAEIDVNSAAGESL